GERTQVRAAGEVRVERGRFHERADLEQPPPVVAREWPAEQLDRARVRMEQAGEQAHRRRLAGAVGAEEAVDNPARDGQVEAVEGEPRAVALAQAARRQGEGAGGGHRRLSCPGDASRAARLWFLASRAARDVRI